MSYWRTVERGRKMESLEERKLLLIKQIHQLERQLNELKWQNYCWSQLPPPGAVVDALAATYVIARPNSKGK